MPDDIYLDFAKENKNKLITNLIRGKFRASAKTAIFMAGSPGAGKTEVATGLADNYVNYVIIDADSFREKFPGYNGKNSSDFQKASSWLVEETLKYVLANGYSFILDATFALLSANNNIRRALKNDFNVKIYYVYQDPIVAWNFTKIREKVEGRHVPKATFINAFFKSRENIIKAKQTFPEIELNLIIKNYSDNTTEIHTYTDNVELILPEQWNKEELEEKLND
ncbi:MAG: zeta toxin family protein [Streptococcaceae bacterium]|jgi:predicted ABC-type ATPase|nr:zeta toxin family protein [Streptococcaceae bacterium]